VIVVSSRELLTWFDRARPVLDGDTVASISDVADRAATWNAPADSAQNSETLYTEFALVRAAVNAAIRRRVAWAIIGVVVTYGVLWTTVATLSSAGVVNA
jgi:hypothetical protein